MRCAACGITFKITCNMERKQKNYFVSIRSRNNPAASKIHHIEKQIFIYGNSQYGPASWTRTKGDTSDIAIVQPAELPRTSRPGLRVSEHMHLFPSCVRLPYCFVSRALANSALEAWKNYVGKDEEDWTGLGRAELL